MNPLRLVKVASIAAPLVFFFGACASSQGREGSSGVNDVVGPGGAGGGGGGGAGGAKNKTSSASFMGQGGGADAAPPDPMVPCHGNKDAWTALTTIPGSCVNDADCCVIMSPCFGDAQIVAKTQMDAALEAWSYCAAQCNDCVPPAIDVVCAAGECRGRLLTEAKPNSLLRVPHCGGLNMIIPFTGMTDTHFACGG
jgi:hypothetical protein